MPESVRSELSGPELAVVGDDLRAIYPEPEGLRKFLRDRLDWEFHYVVPAYETQVSLFLVDRNAKGTVADLLRAVVDDDSHKRDDVRDRFRELLRRMGWEEHATPAGPATPPTVMIRVLRLPRKRYSMRAWLLPDLGKKGPLSEERGLAESEIPEFLSQVRDEAAARLNELAPTVALKDVDIEFVLPYRDIALGVDRWDFTEGGKPSRIGAFHRVVVRRLESDVRPALRNYVRSRWVRLATTVAVVEDLKAVPGNGAVLAMADGQADEGFFDDLRLADAVSCVLLGCCTEFGPRDPLPPALHAVFWAGVPVVAWFRRPLWKEDSSRALKELKDLCQARPVGLPENVRALRQKAKRDDEHAGSHLTLLYEDPGRVCPDVGALVPPKGRGR